VGEQFSTGGHCFLETVNCRQLQLIRCRNEEEISNRKTNKKWGVRKTLSLYDEN